MIIQEDCIILDDERDISKAEDIFNPNIHSISFGDEFDIGYEKYITNEFLEKFLEKYKNVRGLYFSAHKVDYEFLYHLHDLKYLHFSPNKKVDFSKLPQLQELSMPWYSENIKNFSSQKQIKHLNISDFSEKDLTVLNELKKLETLCIVGGRCKSLKGIENLAELKTLELSDFKSLTDISDIITLQKLRYLEFDICWKLEDFSYLGNLKELRALEILDCKRLASLKFVEKLTKLEQIAFLGTTKVNDYDLTPLKHVRRIYGDTSYKKYNANYENRDIEGKRYKAKYYLKQN